MSDTVVIGRTLTMSMCDDSTVDVEISICLGTQAQHSRSNQKIKEFLAAGTIDSIEASIVSELYDLEDEDESIDDEPESQEQKVIDFYLGDSIDDDDQGDDSIDEDDQGDDDNRESINLFKEDEPNTNLEEWTSGRE